MSAPSREHPIDDRCAMWIPDAEARGLATRLLAEILEDVREVLDELDKRAPHRRRQPHRQPLSLRFSGPGVVEWVVAGYGLRTAVGLVLLILARAMNNVLRSYT